MHACCLSLQLCSPSYLQDLMVFHVQLHPRTVSADWVVCWVEGLPICMWQMYHLQPKLVQFIDSPHALRMFIAVLTPECSILQLFPIPHPPPTSANYKGRTSTESLHIRGPLTCTWEMDDLQHETCCSPPHLTCTWGP